MPQRRGNPEAPVGSISDIALAFDDDSAIGFNRRKLEDARRGAAKREAASCRTTDAQVLEDAERPITAPKLRDLRPAKLDSFARQPS